MPGIATPTIVLFIGRSGRAAAPGEGACAATGGVSGCVSEGPAPSADDATGDANGDETPIIVCFGMPALANGAMAIGGTSAVGAGAGA
jgi:hypothetical protein